MIGFPKVREMDNIDIIEQIGKHCDANTHLNLCLASKEYYSYNREVLYEREKRGFMNKILPMLNLINYKRTFHSRLRYIHEILRTLITYKHVLAKPEFSGLREIIKSKLIQFEKTGMSQRKVLYYQNILQL